MIAASILEYMFITVACCEETAKKHRKEVCGRAYFGICDRTTALAVHITAEQSGLSRNLHLDFQD